MVGEMMAKANTYSRRFEEPYWEGTHWKDILSVNTLQREGIDEQLDERAAYFYEAVAISEAMRSTTPGVGQRYVAEYQDKDGDWLVGDRTYRAIYDDGWVATTTPTSPPWVSVAEATDPIDGFDWEL